MEVKGTLWKNPNQANRIGLGKKWQSIRPCKKPRVQPAFWEGRDQADRGVEQA